MLGVLGPDQHFKSSSLVTNIARAALAFVVNSGKVNQNTLSCANLGAGQASFLALTSKYSENKSSFLRNFHRDKRVEVITRRASHNNDVGLGTSVVYSIQQPFLKTVERHTFSRR